MYEEYLVSEGYSTHCSEMQIYTEHPRLHPFVLVLYATFKGRAVDQVGSRVDLDILVSERAGPSLKWLLESSFIGSLEAGNSCVTAVVAVQLNGFAEKLVDLTIGLTDCGIDWYSDFHVGNVCQRRVGEGFCWVDYEKIMPVNKTYQQCMVHALRILFMSSMLTRVPFVVRNYWNSLRSDLADLSVQQNACSAQLRECLRKRVPVSPPSRCVSLMLLRSGGV